MELHSRDFHPNIKGCNNLSQNSLNVKFFCVCDFGNNASLSDRNIQMPLISGSGLFFVFIPG
jgi:hypothetical protein